MIIVMRQGATSAQLSHLLARVEESGCRAHISEGEERIIIGVIGNVRKLDRAQIEQLDGVDHTVPILRPFKLASREFRPADSLVSAGGVTFGGNQVVVVAGPCAVESYGQLLETAQAVKEAGATLLRGGAFKPRTSPYSFQGLGEEGLRVLARVRDETGLPIVTEVMEPQMVPIVADYADVLQVGTRNMQNYALLHAVGEARRPVLLKRGMMSTIDELLMSAEYILSHGNDQIVLCERGIRTFETYTRNTVDIGAVPVLKQLSHLPVIVDPSHGTGKWELVDAVSRAAVAAGADGLIVEVHPRPEEALSDGCQSLKPNRFATMMGVLRRVAGAVGRTL
jgi:3-deoxy-7-phosphoheptulonate synthase